MHEELSAPHEDAFETAVPKVRLLTTHGNGLCDALGLVGRWEGLLSNGGSAEVERELRAMFSGLREAPPPRQPLVRERVVRSVKVPELLG